MRLDEMRRILSSVAYKDWHLRVEEEPIGGVFLQWQFTAPDPCSSLSEPQLQSGRKWLLSFSMTRSEVVATAFKAALTAEEHECREQFRFQGVPIYGPHISLDALVEAASHIEVRS